MEDNYEVVRLKIIKEVDEKFAKLLKDLNDKGTEHSRKLAEKITNMQKDTQEEMEELWSFWKSKLVSIEQSQKLFYEDIFPGITKKVEVAIKMARDSTVCTASALKSVEKAENFVGDSRKIMLGLLIALIVAVVPISVTSVLKLFQDSANQKQTMGELAKLNSGVKVDGVVDIIKGMDTEQQAALLKAIQKK